jgi:dolichyl-phosphate beta-glucosyltransferase
LRTISLTIPCYNEAARLETHRLAELLTHPQVHLVLVDDGSTDGTAEMLDQLARCHPERIEVVHLRHNEGKGEAVRAGLLRGLNRGAAVVGFLDADLSAPPSEALRLIDEARRSNAAVMLGSRVRLLGYDIRRRAARHYLGRAFATMTALALRVPVYDTQCGMKLFRDVPALRAAIADPFTSRWAFDVELIARLLAPASSDVPRLDITDFEEVPLRTWMHKHGSNLGAGGVVRTFYDLVRIAARQRALARGSQR